MKTLQLDPNHILFRSGLFEGMDRVTIQSICDVANVRKLGRGEFLAHQGESAEYLSVLLSGLAVFTDTSSEGDQLIFDWLTPGGSCGISTLLPGPCAYLMSVRSARDSEALQWHRSTVVCMARCHPILLQNGLRSALNMARRCMDRLRLLANQPVERRLAVLLHGSETQIGRTITEGIEVELSDQELAEIAGTTLYTVSRILQRWARSGYLTKRRGRIVIPTGTNLCELVASEEKHSHLSAAAGGA